MREIITLACTECKRRNYSITKNRQKHPQRVELSKHCPWCNKHVVHREVK